VCVCVGLAHLVLWTWFSSILHQFLGCLGVLVLDVCVCVCVCACSLLSVVLYTPLGVVLLSHCISCGYSLEYVLCAVQHPLHLALRVFVHC